MAVLSYHTIQHLVLKTCSMRLCTFILLFVLLAGTAHGQQQASKRPAASDTNIAQLIHQIRDKAKALESSPGMRLGFQAFNSTHKLVPGSVRYSDYVIVRLLFEATRDAGLWNLHWSITDQPPNSDNIWRQWRDVKNESALTPTATAECDELSALYAFLVERAGVR